MRSKLLFKLNRFSEGLSDISKAYRIDSSNIDMRLTHGDYMLINNKILEARNDYNYIINRQAANTDAYLGLAKSYLIAGDFNKSFEYINIALKKNNYLIDAYLMKGLMYKSLKKWKLASSSYQTATQIDPNCYEAFLALGNICEAQEDTLAIQYYNTALGIDSNGIDALYGKALYWQYHDDIPLAKHTYRKILHLDSANFNALYNQGWIKLVLENQFDSAAKYFMKSLEIEPKNVNAWFNMGLAEVKLKNTERAQMCFKNCLKLDPNYTVAQKELNALN
jgi:Tfp pilus assembly protein PilF